MGKYEKPQRNAALLMEFHIGVPVTFLTSDYDASDGSPTREITMILLVGILCIELVGWNKLVVKVQVSMATFISPILRIIRKSKVFNFCAVLKL